MGETAGEFPLHISVSNQSLAVKTADLEIKLDGRQVFRRTMQTGMQHNWEQFTLQADAGAHTLEVSEGGTGVGHTHRLEVAGEQRLVIMFQAPPPRIDVSEPGGQVGFM
ncbi:MAG TPA: hypothetical protein VF586_03405 [Pyrinomonadaceae bacterium]|jgi:hypothetical protein